MDALSAATSARCRRPGDGVRYETVDPAEIAALVQALRTSPASGAYCMCAGTIVFELAGVSPSTITLHHGETLRWEGSGGNVPLASPDLLMDWLSARGMGFVRDEYEAARTSADAAALEAERWRAAMPPSLVPFFDDMGQWYSSKPEWTAAIEAAVPDPVERARVLLELYGSGVGRWSGYPMWEAVPEKLLLELPFDVLFAAIGEQPTDRCCDGAIRLFCSWSFRKRKKQLRGKLPDAIRRRLLAHAQTLPDEHLDRAIDVLR